MMRKEEIYKEMDISKADIQKGESQFQSFSTEMSRMFLSDIYAEYQEGKFMSVDGLYGEYPNFRKVILINFAIQGNEEEKQRLAWGLSNPYTNKKIVDLFHLTYQWINETTDLKVFESLSRGLMFYIDNEEVTNFSESHIDTKVEFAKGVFSWLYIQPDWFREKYKTQEIEIWKRLQDKWPNSLTDEYKIREINKSLGLYIDNNEIWLHEIENPWNFSNAVIKQLSVSGIDIINDYIGEIGMGGPLVTRLILNGEKIQVGGPFVVDDNNKYLCCNTYSRNNGFKLVLIDLKTNDIIELGRQRIMHSPYKFENGEFIVIKGNKKIDLEKDTIRFNLNELELPTT